MVRQDIPWPGADKRSGNLFQDRDWLLPKGYLATEGEKEEMAKPYPEEEDKTGEQDPKKESVVWGLTALYERHKRKKPIPPHQQEPMEGQQQQKPLPKPEAIRPNTLNVTKTKQQWEQEM